MRVLQEHYTCKGPRACSSPHGGGTNPLPSHYSVGKHLLMREGCVAAAQCLALRSVCCRVQIPNHASSATNLDLRQLE